VFIKYEQRHFQLQPLPNAAARKKLEKNILQHRANSCNFRHEANASGKDAHP
jgi:hypothetical protein